MAADTSSDTSSMWDPAAQRGGGNRALRVARCSLCGLERPIGLMVADGGEACDDLRWYCKDAKSCTQRWTSRRPEPVADVVAAGPDQPRRASAGEALTEEAPADKAPVNKAPANQAPANQAPAGAARADQPACRA